MTIPCDCNVTIKEIEKIEKYKDLSVKLSSLWKMKCEVIPIVVGGMGCVSTRLDVYLQNFLLASCVLITCYSKRQF